MSGTNKDSLIAAEPQAVYMPNPTKLPPEGKINLLELAKYAAAHGKDISSMTRDELERFKV